MATLRRAPSSEHRGFTQGREMHEACEQLIVLISYLSTLTLLKTRLPGILYEELRGMVPQTDLGLGRSPHCTSWKPWARQHPLLQLNSLK